MKISLLSNINVDIIVSLLAEEVDVYSPPGYDTWFQEVLDQESSLHIFGSEIIVVLIDANAVLDTAPEIESWADRFTAEFEKVQKTVELFGGRCVLVSTIDIKPRTIMPLRTKRPETTLETTWVSSIDELTDKYPLLVPLDIRRLSVAMGRNKFYDPKMWYAGGIPYSLSGCKAICREILQSAKAYAGRRRKCLVVDLDNTLWGGVVGEDGVNGISLDHSKEGGRFRDIQNRLLQIKNTGILLAIVSKNNPDDALRVIRSHPAMRLREDDFVQIYLNWNPKSENIAALAKDLNIGLDSIVFLDDNPVEREEVKARLPEVVVIEPAHPRELYEDDVIKAYEDYFLSLSLTDEDRHKTEQYAMEKMRRKFESSTNDVEDYLAKLDISVKFRRARFNDIERTAQLTQKTNQFNLTTHRYTVGDVETMLANPCIRVYVASAADKFGDNGTILVAIVMINGKEAELDSFLMSCRVMGRNIEYAVLGAIEEDLRKDGIIVLKARYIKTAKNAPIERFLDKSGFTLIEETEDASRSYHRILSAPANIPPYIRME